MKQLKTWNDKLEIKIIHKAVGGVNESDLSLAETSGVVVIAFNVRAIRGLDDVAEKKGVLIEYYSVIYNIIDSLKSIMAGRLPTIKGSC